MRYLGIDYGTKRIGIAVSDEGNTIAFPKKVLVNGENLISEIQNIITESSITSIILGESKNFKGEDNKIMPEILDFKGELEKTTNLKVFLEPEFLTSVQAERHSDPALLDAGAAALILQSYLDKLNRK